MKRSLATILNRTHPVGDRLLKPTEFRRQIDREMARADRTGEQFCLLVLRNLVDAIPADEAKRIVETLSQRIRRTDDVGLIEHDQLAVLLPVTPLAGGNKLAKQLCDAIFNLIAEPEFEVFCYPSNWLMSSSPSNQSFPEDDSTSSGIAMRIAVSPKPIELLTITPTPTWKRFLDILGAGFGLVCLSPLFLLIGTLIRITSPGPIFYAQERSGQGGKAFKIYKFRSMVIDADAKRAELLEQNEQDGPAFKIANDPRVTLIGKVLRAMSLDELPQLWNVVKGDMSLVGPRPLPVAESLECEPWQRHRLAVKPGLTCTWQLNGKSRVSFAEWMRMDLRYAQQITPWRDLKLIIQTVWTVLFKRNGC